MSLSLSRADLLANLNPAQHTAVVHFEGPLLVVAGAGSGKTRVLTRRVARLIEHHGVDPHRILALTFTNKAAGEMRERISALLGEDPAGMWAGTFHSVGARLLRRMAPLVGRAANFTIYDEDDTLAVVKRLMERHRIARKELAPKAILAAISDAKNALVTVEEYEAVARDPLSRAAAVVYRDLEPEMRAHNAVSFDDLLVLPVAILRAQADDAERERARFQFVLVDEYQDTNRAQYQLVKLLGRAHGNVYVVGDDDQSIYGWRGADIRNILDFERDFPNAAVVRLEENYRSTPNILNVANAVISENTARRGKTLRATRPAGLPVTLTGAMDERDEAEWVADEIESMRSRDPAFALRDVAVLYRTNSQSRTMEEILTRRAIAHRLVGAVRFYDRREIRDVMSYLRLISNPSDDEAFRRAIGAPKRGVGETTVEQLTAIAREAGVSLLAAAARSDLTAPLRPAVRTSLAAFASVIGGFRVRAVDTGVDQLIRELLDDVGYIEYLRAEGPEGDDRIDNVRALVEGAAEAVVEEGGEVGLTPLDHFVQRTALVADLDALDPDADAITLMTVHNAKGLEFPVVFMTGLEDGLFPLSRAFDDPAMLEEERRLFYVAITRAERVLHLSHARSRRRNGETMPSIPSSFLRSIPPALVDVQSTPRMRATGRSVLPMAPGVRRPGTPVYRARVEAEEISQDAPRFALGERVRHARFGAGTIAESSGAGREMKVTVDFDDESIGRKRLVVAYAALERGWDE